MPGAAAALYANKGFSIQKTWRRNPLLPSPPCGLRLCLVTPSSQQLPSFEALNPRQDQFTRAMPTPWGNFLGPSAGSHNPSKSLTEER